MALDNYALLLQLQNGYFIEYFTAFFIMTLANLYLIFPIKIIIKNYLHYRSVK